MKIYDPIHRNVIILKGKVLNCIFNLLHNDFKFYGRDNVITIEEETKLKKGLFLIIGDKNSWICRLQKIKNYNGNRLE